MQMRMEIKMAITERFQVGVIASTHGIGGELNVFPTTDDPQRFKKLKEVTMESERGESTQLHIEKVKFSKKFVIVKFKEFDDINQVERFRGNKLTIPRADAVKLEPGRYFIQDLLGMDIIDEDGNKLGKLVNVLQMAANDVYEMERADGGNNVMIPAIKQCILETNIEENYMKIHVMKGLMD